MSQESPGYAVWVQVPLAALAMVGTLPARTQGLGLVTEPLLQDLHLDRGTYAQINLWATLLGAAFCLPAGRLIDRYGSRLMATVTIAALFGACVWGMSAATGVFVLFGLVTLTRGIGQSALSIVSITMVGKWFTKRLGPAMGLYSVLIGLGFAIAFGVVGLAVREQGWRMAWAEIGLVLLGGLAPLAWLLVRNGPRPLAPASFVLGDEDSAAGAMIEEGVRLGQAMQTPAFWLFAGATALYGLAAAGLGLFNQAILEERGFPVTAYHQTLILSTLVGLVSQLAGGWWGARWSFPRLLSLAMVLYALALGGLPLVTTMPQLWTCAALLGAAGGLVTVTFFSIWSHAYGRRHLGRIQGAAQMLTVLSSAIGPLLFAECVARTGSYAPLLYGLAPVVLLVGLGAWFAPLPGKSPPELRVEPAAST